MNYTTQKGLLTEIACQNDFTRLGILLSQPIMNDSRYDFLADINDKIYRIRCKSAIPTGKNNNAFMFPTANKNWNKGKYKDYHEQIDFFYTCYNNQGYLVPIEEVGKKGKTLRLKNEISNPRINWAEDYQIEKILVEKLNYKIPTFVSFATKGKKETKAKNYCQDCGIIISSKATYCKNCVKKTYRIYL